MNDGLFLVARVAPGALGETLDARLNIRTRAALLEYNRCVIVIDRRTMG